MDSRVQMPVQKRANQRTAEFFHRDANEAVAERLPADLFELSTSFSDPREAGRLCRGFGDGSAARKIARVGFRQRSLHHSEAKSPACRDCDVLIAARALIERETGIRIDLG